MGRGRQKAKHTKVARELKYFSPDTNYSALERELGHGEVPSYDIPASDENLSKWADFADNTTDGLEDDSYEQEDEAARA
jgi:hypothetical protein